MSMDMTLMQAYLANVQMALHNSDVSHATALVESMQNLLPQAPRLPHPSLQMSASVGLDTGLKRSQKPNEDFAFATSGQNLQNQESYGLFIVADGMGGHVNGRVASRLAVETVVQDMLPFLHTEYVHPLTLGKRLVDAVQHANTSILQRNHEVAHVQAMMGTTLTAAAVFGGYVCIVNVGDSRTYLYRPGTGLRLMTRDHSVVAGLVACGDIAAEDIYTHPQRNQITRSLGQTAVEVDLFQESLQDQDVLLLCSDGLWEMTRDQHIEHILSSALPADVMAEHLVHLAMQGGGLDNIGLVVSQIRMNIATMQTMLIPLAPVCVAVTS